jgi:hypothetical protein
LPERHPCGSKTEPQAVPRGDNSHVSNILPLTTFRTIDLGGKEFPDPLFSRFCAEMRVFLGKSCTRMCAEEPGLGAGGHPGLEPAQRRLRQFSRRFERIAPFIAILHAGWPTLFLVLAQRWARPPESSSAQVSVPVQRTDANLGAPGCWAAALWHSGLPPFPQRMRERMGHPSLFVVSICLGNGRAIRAVLGC